MPHLFGNITTHYWNGLSQLSGWTDRELYVVKICNTAKGQTWDCEWPSVYPDWDDINAYRIGHMTWGEFRERYLLKLEKSADKIIEEFLIIKSIGNVNNKMVVLTCHETDPNKCHRTLLMEWLMAKHEVNHLLDCDKIICDECYQIAADDGGNAWTEDEWNQIVGKVMYGPCDTCWR